MEALKVTIYVADDGTEFRNEEDCVRYELVQDMTQVVMDGGFDYREPDLDQIIKSLTNAFTITRK